jgi:hypothetical protein
MIVVLCHRYGPSLQKAGFPDVSATHLEYDEAKKLGIPVYMYIRDRLEADYCIAKKNKKKDVELLWVREPHDRRLFDLLGEHRKLAHGKPGTNWFETFRDTVDLKALIKRDFGPMASRNELEALVMENRVPIMAVEVDTKLPHRGIIEINVRLRNVGSVPAYRLFWDFERYANKNHETPILAPQQETNQTLFWECDGPAWESQMTITYFMPQGHRVRDEYTVSVKRIGLTAIAAGGICRSKTYHVASGDVRPFVIADDK